MKKGSKGSRILVILLTASLILSCVTACLIHNEIVSLYTGFRVSNEDSIALALRKGLKDRSSKLTVTFYSYVEDTDDIKKAVDGWMERALEETDDPTEGDYLRYQLGGYEVRYSDREDVLGRYRYTVKIIPVYYTFPEQEQEVTEIVDGLTDSFGFDEKTTDIEKVRTIYGYVTGTVKYDKVHRKNVYNHLKTTAYSALVYKHAVCQGYCVLMYRLLRECGVNTRIITGMGTYEGEEEFHSWNIVELDGLWYNLDVTWNKEMEDNDFFLKSDASFYGHERDREFLTDEFLKKYPVAKKDYPL